jgi:hypothetical protein
VSGRERLEDDGRRTDLRSGAERGIELDAPLDLPDGTNVIIDVIEPHEVPGAPQPPFDPEKAQAGIVASFGRPDLAGDPDWYSKLGKPCG